MTNSIHSALWEWFSGCTLIAKLFFNFGNSEEEGTIISTAGEMVLDEYIDGSQRRRYNFELIRILPIDWSPNDPGNVDMMEDVEKIVEWVREQNDAGNFPKLPSGYTVEQVATLDDNAGYVSAQDQSHAKYMIPFAMDYLRG